jgi:hypothetical protein
MIFMISRLSGLVLIMSGVMLELAGIANANPPTTAAVVRAPELSPQGLAAGISLFIGGALLMVEYRRRRS